MKTWTDVTADGHITALEQLTTDANLLRTSAGTSPTILGTAITIDLGQTQPIVVVIPPDHHVPPLGAPIQLTIHLEPVEAAR